MTVKGLTTPYRVGCEEFFDNLAEGYAHDKPLLIQDTTKEELDYITASAVEAVSWF